MPHVVKVEGKVKTGVSITVTVPVLIDVVGVFVAFNPLVVNVYTVVTVGETEIDGVVCPPGDHE